MPEIFRAFGFSFFFYSREHEPLHIHVEGKGGAARYVWDGGEFVRAEHHGCMSWNKSLLSYLRAIFVACINILQRFAFVLCGSGNARENFS